MNFITFILVIGAGFVIALNFFAIYWFGGMLIPLISGGGPYVPTSPDRVKRMIRFANITSNDTVIDLGSGDGRLLIAAAQAGAKQAIGYEIHPGLVRISRLKARKNNVQDKVLIKKESLWRADVSKANVILLYQIPYAMEKIENKLTTELPAGTRVVSNGFKFPNWKQKDEEADIFLYIKE